MLRRRYSRRESAALRRMARILLRRADRVGDWEQKRRLDRQAFALVQETDEIVGRFREKKAGGIH